MNIDSFVIYRSLFLSLMLMLHIGLFAQSASKNYLQTKTFLDDTGTTFLRHIDYYDELGYVAQTIDVGCNATLTPILTRTDYTTQLKVSRQWVPISSTGLDCLDTMTVASVSRANYGDDLTYSWYEYDDFQEPAKIRRSRDEDQGTVL